ncbi:MAG: 50S ribosomal protein L11 methyltransferase [Bacteroidales bacterium]|nr:50S ribosomal protein L11 methyltransferase [Bacteroidales bacterium]MBD5352737.1 50S ribosomal protein L11 methyltransferase [Bacteroides sp.]MBD5360780.1 50S ribosomal protein L11 methyltransferase [Bacteroides sp.]MBD5361371.1 50S ribosomal protein L11 methyltransferase [Bacteroides sp.]
MNDYRELRLNLKPCSEDATDVLAALLADAGYESFVPDRQGLTAYIKDELFNEDALNEALSAFPFEAEISRSVSLVEGQDWNSEWEKNYFKPIVVGERCVIHSSFHTDVPAADYDIVIDPKMAFGTGHHATTSQVISALLDIDESGLSVIDMGTGTGILAILCAMRGAAQVNGIEIDPGAYENALENVSLNGQADRVRLHCGDASLLPSMPRADLFIANINRNIITGDLAAYVSSLKPGATMLLSGFYEADIPVIMEVAAPLGLTEVSHSVLNDWTCLKLKFN